ncbi:MAG: hypothetical protein ABW217_05960 [Polyangiaceae bacterium]
MAGKKRANAAPSLGGLAARILSRWGSLKDGLPLERLESELDDQRRYDIVAALKELEKAQLGELSAGRRGHKTMFQWAPAAARAQKRVAAAAPNESPPTSRSTPSLTAARKAAVRERASSTPPPLLEHSFHVRPNIIGSFRLPADVSRAEIDRLCQLLQALPFNQ